MNSNRGFTLIEAIVSTALVTSALLVFAYAATLGVRVTAEARYRTVATIAASQKLEQLRAVPSLGDVNDASEYLDVHGNPVCVGRGPCDGAVYLRQWSIAAVPMYPRSVIVEVSSRHAYRPIDAVVLRTVRGRDVP